MLTKIQLNLSVESRAGDLVDLPARKAIDLHENVKGKFVVASNGKIILIGQHSWKSLGKVAFNSDKREKVFRPGNGINYVIRRRRTSIESR